MTPQDAIDIIVKDYTDSYGHIVQKDGDKGDTANREGIVAALYRWNNLPYAKWATHFDQVLNQLEKSPGIYIRHGFPKSTDQDYVGDPARFSRDQQTTIEIGMGEYPTQQGRLQRLHDTHKARWWKYQNKDWGTGTYSRSLYRETGLAQEFADIRILINSCLAYLRRGMDAVRYVLYWIGAESNYNPDVSNDINLALEVIHAYKHGHTCTSWIASRLYRWTNPQKAVETYFSDKSGAPPIHVLYKRPLWEAMYS